MNCRWLMEGGQTLTSLTVAGVKLCNVAVPCGPPHSCVDSHFIPGCCGSCGPPHIESATRCTCSSHRCVNASDSRGESRFFDVEIGSTVHVPTDLCVWLHRLQVAAAKSVNRFLFPWQKYRWVLINPNVDNLKSHKWQMEVLWKSHADYACVFHMLI